MLGGRFGILRNLCRSTATLAVVLFLGGYAAAASGQAFDPDARLSLAPTLGTLRPVGYFNEYFDSKFGAGVRLSYALSPGVALVANGRFDTFSGSWLYHRHPTYQNQSPDLSMTHLGVGVERIVLEPEADGASVRVGGGAGLAFLRSSDFVPLPGDVSYTLSQTALALNATVQVGYSMGRVTIFGDTGYWWAPLQEDDFIRALRVGPKLYILESLKAVPIQIGIRTRL